VTDIHEQPNDATPLTPEERQSLIPSHITVRRELNELEQQNILAADVWALQRRHDPVSESFAKKLHHRMFRRVWKWAGQYRTSDKNIGVPRAEIHNALYQALDNARFWVENKTFPPDEIAVRFHHALVAVHPFPNGNGRWSRLMADVLVERLGQKRFSWGGGNLRAEGEMRDAYIAALEAADDHDFAPLHAFARS